MFERVREACAPCWRAIRGQRHEMPSGLAEPLLSTAVGKPSSRDTSGSMVGQAARSSDGSSGALLPGTAARTDGGAASASTVGVCAGAGRGSSFSGAASVVAGGSAGGSGTSTRLDWAYGDMAEPVVDLAPVLVEKKWHRNHAGTCGAALTPPQSKHYQAFIAQYGEKATVAQVGRRLIAWQHIEKKYTPRDDRVCPGHSYARGGDAIGKQAIDLNTGEPLFIRMIERERVVKDGKNKLSQVVSRALKALQYEVQPAVRTDARGKVKHYELLTHLGQYDLFHFWKSGAIDSIPVPNLINAFMKLIQVVLRMHAAGLVHKDLKLENVVVRIDDVGLERGIALHPCDVDFVESVGLRGYPCGTEGYIPREALNSRWLFSGKGIDYYALAVLMKMILSPYFMLNAYNPLAMPTLVRAQGDCAHKDQAYHALVSLVYKLLLTEDKVCTSYSLYRDHGQWFYRSEMVFVVLNWLLGQAREATEITSAKIDMAERYYDAFSNDETTEAVLTAVGTEDPEVSADILAACSPLVSHYLAQCLERANSMASPTRVADEKLAMRKALTVRLEAYKIARTALFEKDYLEVMQACFDPSMDEAALSDYQESIAEVGRLLGSKDAEPMRKAETEAGEFLSPRLDYLLKRVHEARLRKADVQALWRSMSDEFKAISGIVQAEQTILAVRRSIGESYMRAHTEPHPAQPVFAHMHDEEPAVSYALTPQEAYPYVKKHLVKLLVSVMSRCDDWSVAENIAIWEWLSGMRFSDERLVEVHDVLSRHRHAFFSVTMKDDGSISADNKSGLPQTVLGIIDGFC